MSLPPRDHRITLPDAAALTSRHRASGSVKGGAFHRDQVLELLNQKGCAALRIYHGRDADGRPAFVLVGVDEKDADMVNGTMLELCFPCPPWCPPDNALTA